MEQENVVLNGCELRCCSMADKIRYRWTFWLRTCVRCMRSCEIVCLKSGRRFDQRFYYRARSSAYVSILHTLELKHVWNISEMFQCVCMYIKKNPFIDISCLVYLETKIYIVYIDSIYRLYRIYILCYLYYLYIILILYHILPHYIYGI